MSEIPTRKKPPNFLEINADKHPDKNAVVGPERSMTYGQLCQRARALARSLYGLGVRPGDQVARMTYNPSRVVPVLYPTRVINDASELGNRDARITVTK